MTRDTSRALANLLLAATGAVAGYLVLGKPAPRRVARRAVKVGLTTLIPGYLVQEMTNAWRETRQRAA